MNARMKPSSKSVDILYKDDQYLVVNKPSGLVVIPTPRKEQRTLTSVVNWQNPADENQAKLYPCHRLDRDTSGAIIFARGKKHQKLLMDEFKNRNVKKEYFALVHGKLEKREGKIQSAVQDFDDFKHRGKQSGRMALTKYQVIEEKKNFSIVKIFLETGRTNQARIQFTQIGHPLIGERKYAFAKDYSLKFRRTALHAQVITWINPVTKESMKVQAPIPEDLKRFIRKN